MPTHTDGGCCILSCGPDSPLLNILAVGVGLFLMRPLWPVFKTMIRNHGVITLLVVFGLLMYMGMQLLAEPHIQDWLNRVLGFTPPSPPESAKLRVGG